MSVRFLSDFLDFIAFQQDVRKFLWEFQSNFGEFESDFSKCHLNTNGISVWFQSDFREYQLDFSRISLYRISEEFIRILWYSRGIS